MPVFGNIVLCFHILEQFQPRPVFVFTHSAGEKPQVKKDFYLVSFSIKLIIKSGDIHKNIGGNYSNKY